MPTYYEFQLPGKILSGDGALEHPHELAGLGSRRPLLLSDEGLVKAGAVALVKGPWRRAAAPLPPSSAASRPIPPFSW